MLIIRKQTNSAPLLNSEAEQQQRRKLSTEKEELNASIMMRNTGPESNPGLVDPNKQKTTCEI